MPPKTGLTCPRCHLRLAGLQHDSPADCLRYLVPRYEAGQHLLKRQAKAAEQSARWYKRVSVRSSKEHSLRIVAERGQKSLERRLATARQDIIHFKKKAQASERARIAVVRKVRELAKEVA